MTQLLPLGYWLSASLILLVVILAIVMSKIKRPTKIFLSLFASAGKGIAANEYFARFTGRHQSIVRFIQARMNLKRFTGLPLTLLAVAFVYFLSLFFGVTDAFLDNDATVAIDTRVNKLFLLFRFPPLVRAALAITYAGNSAMVAIAVVGVVVLLWIWKKRTFILPFIVTVVGSITVSTLAKLIIHRSRPINPVYLESSYSFPSGHATIAVALFGFIAYIGWRLFSKRYRTWFVIFNLLIIFAIGFSRIFLGVHYFSDVSGGYLLGALWLIIGISLREWRALSKKSLFVSEKMSSSPTRSVKILTTIIIFAEVAAYAFGAYYFLPPRTPVVDTSTSETIASVDTLITHFNLPRTTETLTGGTQEPLSFLIVAHDDAAFTQAFQKAGWNLADTLRWTSIKEIYTAGIRHLPYATAPMTPSFWNNEVNDFGFEKSTSSQSIKQRHHARFWKAPYKTIAGEQVYVGTASLDVGIKWGITHTIAPDIDTEREFLLTDLQTAGVAKSSEIYQLVNPILGKNFTGDPFFTDGKLYSLDFDF